MTKWQYKLEAEGKQLLDTILNNDESFEGHAKVIDQLRVCCEKVMSLVHDERSMAYFDFCELFNVMEGEAEVLRSNPSEIFEWDFTGATELTEARLARFYDLCDAYKVWVGL